MKTELKILYDQVSKEGQFLLITKKSNPPPIMYAIIFLIAILYFILHEQDYTY